MAEHPEITLHFREGCPDCGERRVRLPDPLPPVGDDVDWLLRDYDGFRIFMMEELAARFPERTRWTTADLEVVLVEVLAAALDQLSDQADRVASEGCLDTARRPASVRRLLAMIGFDAVHEAVHRGDLTVAPGDDEAAKAVALERLWRENPHLMNRARRQGPRAVHTNRRMVTLADYGNRLEDHPLVERAHAWTEWSGSWNTIHIAVVLWENLVLDQPTDLPDEFRARTDDFHGLHGLPAPAWSTDPTIRTLLRPYFEARRMVGREVLLRDAIPVGISLSISIRVAASFFQSEVRRAVEQALGRGPEGFFRPGRLAFGEDVHASDLFQTLVALEGVLNVCLNRMKKVGRQFPDQTDAGVIVLDGLEIAICDNDPARPERGYYRLFLHGGRKG